MVPQMLERNAGCDQVSNPEPPRGSGVSQPMGVSAEMFTVEHTQQLSQPHIPSSSPESVDSSSQPEQMTSSPKKSGLLQGVRLPRKPSLPSLFGSSSSFHQPSILSDLSTSGVLSSPRNDIDTVISNTDCNVFAPSLFLDNDPFAMLASSSSAPSSTRSFLDMGCPSLSESVKPSVVELSPQVPVPQASSARPKSSGPSRPAHTRPAFVPRPSLPSLRALSEMSVVVPRKVRKGTVGARLPHEPWNLDLSSDFGLHSPTETERASAVSPSPTSEDEISDLGSSCNASDESLLPGASELTCVTCDAQAEEAVSSRSLSFPGHDADVDSLPSLSYTISEPSSSALSRASSLHSPWPEVAPNQNSCTNNRAVEQEFSVDPDDRPQLEEVEEDPLSYHSDFDYYTQSLSDLSDFEPDEPQSQQEPFRSPGIAQISCGSINQEADFKPGTSADTMRSSLSERLRMIGRSTPSLRKETLHGGHEWRAQRGAHERHTSAADQKGLEENEYGQGSGSRSRNNGGLDDRAGAEGRGDYSRTCGAGRPSLSAAADYSSSSESEDGTTVYHSIDGTSDLPSPIHSRTQSGLSRSGGGSDDDVPLAQRMPTALKAQKSIRQQLRDERQQRKLERAKSSHCVPPSPLPPLPLAQSSITPTPRRPTHEPHKSSTSGATSSGTGSLRQESSSTGHSPLPPEDLSRRLLHLHTSIPSTSADRNFAPSLLMKARLARSATTSPTQGHRTDNATYVPFSTARATEAPLQDRSLMAARSFRKPDRRHAERPSVELPPGHSLGRSKTIATRPAPEDICGRSSMDAYGRSVRDGRSNPPTGHEHSAKSHGRISEDNRRPSGSTSRPSVDRENNTSNQRGVQRPSLPAPVTMPPHQPSTKVPVVQQRVFIGDMQRFNTVELTPATNAGDVIKLMAGQGILDRSGSWMLFELAQDYGMERPIRDFEVLLDVSSSWNKDKLLNAFVIKLTPLAKLLRPSAMPNYSPTHRGWVEWESKRGKWSKRWMELREHGLWLSKRDTGKDEIFLCSVSNFDAYSVTRRYKSPRPFVFAVKSTDHLSLFENAADYLHMFACNPKEGETWMEAILVARSYVLHQERNVLYTKSTSETHSQAKPLSRSRTRKQSVSGRPAQPLISVPPPFSVSATTHLVFEPGSLLAKRNGDLSP